MINEALNLSEGAIIQGFWEADECGRMHSATPLQVWMEAVDWVQSQYAAAIAQQEAQGELYGWVFNSIAGGHVLYVGAAKPEGAPDRTFPVYTLPDPVAEAKAPQWQPIETAPEGVRVLLGPRNAPVVGMVSQPVPWEDRGEPFCTVVHYNGNTLISDYHCSEWCALDSTQLAEPF